MNKLDILILIIIGLAGFSCFITGFLRSTMGLAAIGGGIFMSVLLWQYLAPLLNNFLKNDTAAKWLSVLAILIVASITFDLILIRIQKIAEKSILGWINNLIGAGFGIAMASLFLGMVLLLLTQYEKDFFNDSIDDSRLAKPLITLAKRTIDMVKPIVKDDSSTELNNMVNN